MSDSNKPTVFGRWQDYKGEWCIAIAGSFQPGDKVKVKRRGDGRISNQVLGEKVREGLFRLGKRTRGPENNTVQQARTDSFGVIQEM